LLFPYLIPFCLLLIKLKSFKGSFLCFKYVEISLV
jgi:hypothetical protein